LLRREYDLIMIDGGAHVTPAQAALVELADEIVVVVTPDVLCLRSMRRAITAWHSLAVRDEEDLQVLVNKVSKQNIFPHSAVDKLTSGTVLQSFVPSMYRYLEPSLNARDPREVTETAWWKVIRLIGGELGVVKAMRQVPTAAPASGQGSASGDEVQSPGGSPTSGGDKTSWRGRRRRVGAERGSITVENVALFPVVLLVLVMVWQLCLTSLVFVWSGLASGAAAREYSMNQDPKVLHAVAARSLPGWLADDMTVVPLSADTVEVSLGVPAIFPGGASFATRLRSQHTVVREP
jgi:pilus assembly protein CpaE